ncbi:hypothetical protein CASFOL_019243 [Castilleja foliolosa]|uniref:Protein Jade-1 n=1 Tax=Castilleja foliolosa TaxID=1961234 RepID=A0ABD3D533_9LAMI
MESKTLNPLPPLKRFRLMQQQSKQNDNANNPSTINPENSTTHFCLPAKKRKDPPPPTTTFCLPAKKRIWAFQPPLFDLNLDYEPSDTHEPEIHPEEIEIIQNDANEDDSDDDGIVCSVCGSTDGDPTDPIVLCDGCDLMVHTTCYGHPFTNTGIPEGDWFCAQCLDSKNPEKNSDPKAKKELSCCLCPVESGALKPTTDGRWAHLVCAIYVPEVFFLDSEGREGIDCGKVLSRRWERKCYVCELKNNGCVIDCSEPNCGLAFHVTCGLKEELCIEYRQGKNKGAVVAAFCRAHTDIWKKQERTGKFKIVARDENKK